MSIYIDTTKAEFCYSAGIIVSATLVSGTINRATNEQMPDLCAICLRNDQHQGTSTVWIQVARNEDGTVSALNEKLDALDYTQGNTGTFVGRKQKNGGIRATNGVNGLYEQPLPFEWQGFMGSSIRQDTPALNRSTETDNS